MTDFLRKTMKSLGCGCDHGFLIQTKGIDLVSLTFHHLPKLDVVVIVNLPGACYVQCLLRLRLYTSCRLSASGSKDNAVFCARKLFDEPKNE